MLDTGMFVYPWYILALSVIGLVVVCAFAFIALQIVWAFVKATIQAFIYQLFAYKKAKINDRAVNWKIFWPSYREMWFFLLGSDFSKDPIRRGHSFFYGWTFTVRKDPQFVPMESTVHRMDDYRDEEEDLDDEDDSDIVATYDPQNKK